MRCAAVAAWSPLRYDTFFSASGQAAFLPKKTSHSYDVMCHFFEFLCKYF
jgi:uncharacterized protein YutD